MTLDEKIRQLGTSAGAIPRLGIPQYDWRNECLHGAISPAVGETTTVFPQVIGLAATWDTELLHRVAISIADEVRAIHHEFARRGSRVSGTGLTVWSPNVNIFRDPRWGRGQETYGEDPYLTSQMAVAYVQGLQGEDPKYFKVIATPKHFAVHSGPESLRHRFDAQVSERDLRETYLPAFEACVRKGKAFSIMCAYNRINGEACCGSAGLLTGILRSQWNFSGYVVADCGAIDDMHQGHGVVSDIAEASAAGVLAGCDLDCSWEERDWRGALQRRLVSAEDIDNAARRLLEAHFRLGLFDPPEYVSYAQTPIGILNCREHQELAVQAARESIVLLRNDNDFLPLSKSVRSIAVIGPNADEAANALLGNYHGTPNDAITPLQGIRSAVSPNTVVGYARGCQRIRASGGADGSSGPEEFAEAKRLATATDVVILCLGLASGEEGLEGEENKRINYPGFIHGDRLTLGLPDVQQELLRAVFDTGKPLVLILINGSEIAVNWADEHCAAIVEAWYPGEQGGKAIAEVLFGDYNPAGRLPVTFYQSAEQLPPFEDYSMSGRTYRYFTGEPLYPFGHGLSYTRFEYSNLTVEPPRVQAGQGVIVRAVVRNAGRMAGDEVVQLYLRDEEASAPVPVRSLQGFQRLHLQPGDEGTVAFALTGRQMSLINADLQRVIEPGTFEVSVGGGQPHIRSTHEPTSSVLRTQFEVVGEPHRIEE